MFCCTGGWSRRTHCISRVCCRCCTCGCRCCQIFCIRRSAALARAANASRTTATCACRCRCCVQPTVVCISWQLGTQPPVALAITRSASMSTSLAPALVPVPVLPPRASTKAWAQSLNALVPGSGTSDCSATPCDMGADATAAVAASWNTRRRAWVGQCGCGCG